MKLLNFDSVLTVFLLASIGISIGFVTTTSKSTFSTVSRQIVGTGARRCAEQVAQFLGEIQSSRKRISGTVTRGVLRREDDHESYIADMYGLFVDNPEFLAVYQVLPSGRTFKIHREDTLPDGVTPVLKFMDWRVINSTASISQNYVFTDPSRTETRVAEPPELRDYSPDSDDDVVETRALPGDGLHFVGPVVETYTGTDRYIFELLFSVPWPNASPPVKSIFKVEVLIAKINLALEEASVSSRVSGFVTNSKFELVAMASSLPVTQITSDLKSGERRFVKLSEAAYLTGTIFPSKEAFHALEISVSQVLSPSAPSTSLQFQSGAHYLVEVTALKLGTDWVVVTFADVREGLGELERGQEAVTIALAVAIVLVVCFTIYTLVVRVALRRGLHSKYEVIFNSTSEGIVLCDAAGVIKTFNLAASKLVSSHLGRGLTIGDPLKGLFEHGSEVQAELEAMVEQARVAETRSAVVSVGPASAATTARSGGSSASRLEIYRMEAGAQDPADALFAQGRAKRPRRGQGGPRASLPKVSIKTNLGQLPVVITMGAAKVRRGYDAVVVIKDDGTQRRYEMALVENARVTELVLLSLMPRSIAERMKRRKSPTDRIADMVEECSCFFMDLANFTPLSTTQSAAAVVELLNDLYVACDDIIAQYPSLEKVKTIGDAIFVVGGAPIYLPSHTADLTAAAFQMQDAVRAVSKSRNLKLGFRQGIHVGPAVSGVVGKMKQTWDLWGDTVNIASRTESTAEPNTLHVTEAAKVKLDPSKYLFKERLVEMKGKGLMKTFTVVQK